MRGTFDLLKRFRADERGAFAVIFGLLAIVLVAMAGAAVDYTGMETARAKAQIALDSAALGLAPKIFTQTEEQLRKSAEDLVKERLNDSTLTVSVDSADATTATGTLKLEGKITVPMAFVQLIGIPTMTTKLTSEATRGSVNLEVAVALDITGSMSGTKIQALRSAATELIPLVVNDIQTPTYSKMSLAPYSMGVNVGAYASQVRGPVAPGKSISGASWAVANSAKSISSVSKANPGKVKTSSAHGYSTGDRVYVSGVSGMTQLNGNQYTITVTSTTEFTIGVNTNTNSYSNYNSGGTVTKCQTSACEVVLTSNGHGFNNGDFVYITGVNGMTQINGGTGWAVSGKATNTFALSGSFGPNYGAYTSGGTGYCTVIGCQYLRYLNAAGSNVVQQVSNCVSERTANAYSDTAPSTTFLGYNYPNSGNSCISQQIVPLTSNKTTLQNAVNALTDGGSTAGHIGTAWAWYLISPNFAYLFPSANKAAAYDAPNTRKIAIIMTDGEYNTPYCNGVIAKDAGSGSGGNSVHINCNAPNGSSGSQALSLCTAMKNAGILIYTVGFDVTAGGTEAQLLASCATDAGKAYIATSGAGLIAAFKEIGQNISDLRLSQ